MHLIYEKRYLIERLGIYIHIPFCQSKCYYCDFISFANSNKEIQHYVNYLIKEIKMYKNLLKDYSIKTIFIGGGGTPSYLKPKYIYNILNYIYKNFNGKGVTEITIEANPGTLDDKKN